MADNGCGRGKTPKVSTMFPTHAVRCGASQQLDSFYLSPTPSFVGSRSMLNFEDACPLIRSYDPDDNGEEELDEFFHQPGKKRRLSADQVQFLEKSFELDNKLEPERKVQLAKDLGLQPRQVAIWFQNRRARWKTKQLEKDYEILLASYNSLKNGYDSLMEEKEKLLTEVDILKNKLLGKSKSILEVSDNGKHVLELPDVQASNANLKTSKQEDLSSGRSDIFDSDSPHYTDGVHSLLETGDSSYAFEQDQSDLSQDEDDNLNKSLLSVPYVFPKLEDDVYSVPTANFEDSAFWSWSY